MYFFASFAFISEPGNAKRPFLIGDFVSKHGFCETWYVFNGVIYCCKSSEALGLPLCIIFVSIISSLVLILNVHMTAFPNRLYLHGATRGMKTHLTVRPSGHRNCQLIMDCRKFLKIYLFFVSCTVFSFVMMKITYKVRQVAENRQYLMHGFSEYCIQQRTSFSLIPLRMHR